MPKHLFQSLKSYKNSQNHVLTNNGVLWLILKLTKNVTKVMNILFYAFKYVSVVWWWKLGWGFYF